MWPRLHALWICLALVPFRTTTAEVLLADDFNSYPAGDLPEQTEWPSPIPDTEPAAHWTTSGHSGAQEIVTGAEAGRDGQVFAYSETAEGEFTSYSHTTLATPHTDGDDWELSLDFLIESLEEPGSAYTIVGVFDGVVGDHGRLVAVSLSRNSRTGHIQASVQRHGGSSFFQGGLLEQVWYSLTIRGNHDGHLMDVRLHGEADGFEESLTGLTYANTTHAFDVIAIGDSIANLWTSGRINRVFLDNLTLRVVADP